MMRRTIALLIAGCVVTGPAGLYSQTRYHLPPRAEYDVATIGLKDGRQLAVNALTHGGDSVTYRRGLDGADLRLGLEEVQYLRVREGTNVGKGLGIGLAAGTGIGLGGLANERFSKGEQTGYLLAWSLAGAAIGAITGALRPRLRRYYVHAAPPR